MAGRRPERIASQIREEISRIIAGELHDPRIGFVTVTDAKVSPDLRHAKIFITVLGTEDQAAESLDALKHASGYIRHQLGAVIRLKFMPELHFVLDDTIQTAARIEEILSEEVEKAREREQEQ
ncbi:MAG: 30S ribosome-binding factor RbfA [Blastocatellia bacterium]|nr:30S ribosome-binding factor RbfA [Blastocatellia bacterium]